MRAINAAALAFTTILICQPMTAPAAQSAPMGEPLIGPKPDTVTLQTTEHATFGRYLTDSRGRAIYMFDKDEKGKSRCAEACREAWPPVYSQGEPEAGRGVDPKKLGVVGGGEKKQVSYNGWPLYYYKLDGNTTATSGQDVFSYDGNWFLLSPAGEPIERVRPGEAKVPR